MTEQEALNVMIPPSQKRVNKPFRGGVIQICITSSCDLACFNCTQGSQLSRPYWSMTPEQFDQACSSLHGYWGVVGVFGGNPVLAKDFPIICEILRKHFPKEQCGIWCNHPRGHGRILRQTFNPAYSNLNTHMIKAAYEEFKRDWPESNPVGLQADSRHSPVYVAMSDIIEDESERWNLISNCDVNKFWSAYIGVFRGELRAWFCEIAGAQAILHQYESDYPDTGLELLKDQQDRVGWRVIEEGEFPWWQLPMRCFTNQVRKHCHECSVPLRGYGELSQSGSGVEQVSKTHASIYKPKRPHRQVQIVTELQQLGIGRLQRVTDYIGNGRK